MKTKDEGVLGFVDGINGFRSVTFERGSRTVTFEVQITIRLACLSRNLRESCGMMH